MTEADFAERAGIGRRSTPRGIEGGSLKSAIGPVLEPAVVTAVGLFLDDGHNLAPRIERFEALLPRRVGVVAVDLKGDF